VRGFPSADTRGIPINSLSSDEERGN